MRVFRFILATLVFCIVSMFFVAYGNNRGINGDFDWNTFGDSFFDIFGGLGSFGALILVIVLLAGAYVLILTQAQANRNQLAAGVGVALIVIALIVGTAWVRVDWNYFGGLWPFVLFLLLAAACTALVLVAYGSLSIRRRTTATTTTTES